MTWQRGLETWSVYGSQFLFPWRLLKGAMVLAWLGILLTFYFSKMSCSYNMRTYRDYQFSLITYKIYFIHRQSNFVLLDACNFAWILVDKCQVEFLMVWFDSMQTYLFGAKPLSQPMLGYCQLHPKEKLQYNFNQNTKYFLHEIAYENIEMAAILCWERWVKTTHSWSKSWCTLFRDSAFFQDHFYNYISYIK